MSQDPLETLEQLANEKQSQVTAWIASLSSHDRRGLFIEVCRALDYEQVRQMSESSNAGLRYQEFDLMLRGWNRTVVAMLTPDFIEEGIPFRPSTEDSLRVGRSILHEMGLISLLRKTASMVRHGMVELTWEENSLSIRSPKFSLSDHFLDQIDVGELPRLSDDANRLFGAPVKSAEEIREAMKEQIFPWKGAPGVTMVGYGATPEIDAYFLSATAEQMLDWRDEAGIHPGTDVLGNSGALLTGITGLLASIYLKHIRFVLTGYNELDDINFPTSLTIWEPRSELVKNLTSFMGGKVTEDEVSSVLEMLIVSPNNTRFFGVAERPYVPLLVQVSKMHVLRPVASIFRNPLHGARMALEFDMPSSEATFREPREAWMRNELNALFLGTGFARNRYRRSDRQQYLCRSAYFCDGDGTGPAACCQARHAIAAG